MKDVTRGPTPETSVGLRRWVWLAMAWGVLGLTWAGGLWVPGVLALAGMTVGHWYSHRTCRRGHLVHVGRVLTLLLGVSFLYMAADLVTAFAGGLLPQGQFGIAAQAITSFRLRTRRDLYGTLVHSLLLLYVAADVAYSPWLLVFLLGYGLSVLGALATATIVDLARVAQAPSPAQTGGGARPTWRQGWLALLWAIAGVLALSVLLFMGMPRLGSNQMITAAMAAVPLPGGVRGQTVTPLFPLVSLTASGSTGSSPRMDLAYRGRPSYEVVMYVRSQVRSYWRALTFERYDGAGWESTLQSSSYRRGSRGGFEVAPPASSAGGTGYVQTYSVVRDQSDALFTGYWAELVQYPDSLLLRSEDVVLARQPVRSGTTYTVLSRLPALDQGALHRDRAVHEDAVYTALPALAPRALGVAAQAVKGAGSDYEKALALERYLRATYRYDLNVPPLREGAEAVEVFLFDHRRGFCQQFATAMAVLGRAAGLPTRVVTGYLPGQYDPIAGAFAVRAADAHSWVEVHFAEHGWVPFDPTPEVGDGARDHTAMAWLTGSWGGPTLADIGVALGPVVGAMIEGFAGIAGVLGIAAAIGLLVVLVPLGVLWIARRRPGIPAWTRRWAPARTSREEALRRYGELESALARAGVARRAAWETPEEHLDRAGTHFPQAAEALGTISETVTTAAYSQGFVDAMALGGAVRSLRRRLQGRGA